MKKENKNKDKDEFKINKKKKKTKLIVIFTLLAIVFFAVYSAISAYNWQKIAKAISSASPSVVLDTNNNIISYLGEERKQSNVPLSTMPNDLINAYISIEDQRYYSHFGVDIKRTSAAILSYVLKRDSSFGGSSITQQLVKNITNDNYATITRKVTEWIRAIELEAFWSKEEILEAYLNIIYVGPNIYGVNNGAKYYFDKKVSDLNLAECAFLAGINNSPNSYNPFNEEKDNTEKITKRTKTVLNKMLELQYISKENYDEAIKNVDDGFKFKKGNVTTIGKRKWSL